MKKGLGIFLILCGTAMGDAASDLLKAQTDYQRMLTEAKLARTKMEVDKADAAAKRADADHKHALAEYYRVRSQHLMAYMRIMQDEYDRVRSEEANLKARMYDVRRHYDLCGELADGLTRRGGFQCLQYFRRYIVSFALQKKMLFDDKVEALPASEFVSNDPGSPVEGFKGGNVGQLIVFAEARDYSFAPFGRAHGFVIGFLDSVQAGAQAKINEYRNWIDGIRAGVLDVFKLPTS